MHMYNIFTDGKHRLEKDRFLYSLVLPACVFVYPGIWDQQQPSYSQQSSAIRFTKQANTLNINIRVLPPQRETEML